MIYFSINKPKRVFTLLRISSTPFPVCPPVGPAYKSSRAPVHFTPGPGCFFSAAHPRGCLLYTSAGRLLCLSQHGKARLARAQHMQVRQRWQGRRHPQRRIQRKAAQARRGVAFCFQKLQQL